MPLISIIIPCHNVEKYLNACLNSVTNQAYTNIEIICVEDHSIDGTWKILQDWAKKEKRIKLYQLKETSGVSCARNLGLKVAKGEYINFVDSDDLVSTNGLKDMYHLLKFYNCPIVGENITKIKEDEMLDNPLVTSEFFWFRDFNIRNNPEKLNSISISVWGKLYKREAIQDCFIENCIWEDYDFSIKTTVKNRKIIVGFNPSKHSVGYYYRYNPNGITKSLQMPGPKNLDAITITKSILQGLKSYYQNDPLLEIALHERMVRFLHMNLKRIYESIYLSPEEQKELGDLLQTIYQYHFPNLYHEEFIRSKLDVIKESPFLIRPNSSFHNEIDFVTLPKTHIEYQDYLEAKQKFLTRAKELENEKNS